MKRRIRLTESDLHRIIKESVKKVLTEYTKDFYDEEKDALDFVSPFAQDKYNDHRYDTW